MGAVHLLLVRQRDGFVAVARCAVALVATVAIIATVYADCHHLVLRLLNDGEDLGVHGITSFQCNELGI